MQNLTFANLSLCFTSEIAKFKFPVGYWKLIKITGDIKLPQYRNIYRYRNRDVTFCMSL